MWEGGREGGKEGVALSPSGCSLGTGLRKESSQCKYSLFNTSFSSKHTDLCPQISILEEFASFSLGYFFFPVPLQCLLHQLSHFVLCPQCWAI